MSVDIAAIGLSFVAASIRLVVSISTTDALQADAVATTLRGRLSDAQAATALLGIPVEAVVIGELSSPSGLTTTLIEDGMSVAIICGAALVVLVGCAVLLCRRRRVVRKRAEQQQSAVGSMLEHGGTSASSISEPLEFNFDSGPLGVLLGDTPGDPIVDAPMVQGARQEQAGIKRKSLPGRESNERPSAPGRPSVPDFGPHHSTIVSLESERIAAELESEREVAAQREREIEQLREAMFVAADEAQHMERAAAELLRQREAEAEAREAAALRQRQAEAERARLEVERRLEQVEAEAQLAEEAHRKELQRRTGALHAQHQEHVAQLTARHSSEVKELKREHIRQSVSAARASGDVAGEDTTQFV